MTRQSPHTVTYKELLELAEGWEQDAARKLSGARATGVTNLNALTHHHEKTKVLARMLRKGLPGKQTDLFALFQQTR
jgi:hypothetical protein